MIDFILKVGVYLWGFFLIIVGIVFILGIFSIIIGIFSIIISSLTSKKMPWMKDDTMTIKGNFTINEKKKK